MLDQRLRHYCRNPRCRAKLKEPVESARAAFCCRSCHDNFYWAHCLVCNESFTRSSSRQKLCTRRNCRREFERNPSLFASPWGDGQSNLKSAEISRVASSPGGAGEGACQKPESNSKSAHFTGGFWRDKSGRGFGWKVVGEQRHLIDRNGRIAIRLVAEESGWWIAQPRIHPELPVFLALDAAKRSAINIALWALPLELERATKRRARNAIPKADGQSRNPAHPATFFSCTWQPSQNINAADVPDIPEFLRRRNGP
jgi:hypothetical protein